MSTDVDAAVAFAHSIINSNQKDSTDSYFYPDLVFDPSAHWGVDSRLPLASLLYCDESRGVRVVKTRTERRPGGWIAIPGIMTISAYGVAFKLTGRAGVSVFFGPGSPYNRALRLGPNTTDQLIRKLPWGHIPGRYMANLCALDSALSAFTLLPLKVNVESVHTLLIMVDSREVIYDVVATADARKRRKFADDLGVGMSFERTLLEEINRRMEWFAYNGLQVSLWYVPRGDDVDADRYFKGFCRNAMQMPI